MRLRKGPIGVILAGGLGRRIGGAKAIVRLRGRPMIVYPLEALASVVAEVAVIAKPDTELPNLPGVTVWIEPELPRHPIVGISHALALASGRPVLVCAADLPLVTPELIDRLARANPAGAPAVIASRAGVMQPLLGCYQPATATRLGSLQTLATRPLRETIAAIGPRLLEIDDDELLFNVNSPDDLLQATAMLDRRLRSYPNVKS
jgi:molybdenum cofactor guanylyltransferase